MEVTSPWIDYAISLWTGSAFADRAADVGEAEAPVQGVLGPYAPLLSHAKKLLQCFRHYASVTYRKEDATVTHYEWYFRDLEE